jgi:hypothetical protein
MVSVQVLYLLKGNLVQGSVHMSLVTLELRDSLIYQVSQAEKYTLSFCVLASMQKHWIINNINPVLLTNFSALKMSCGLCAL